MNLEPGMIEHTAIIVKPEIALECLKGEIREKHDGRYTAIDLSFTEELDHPDAGPASVASCLRSIAALVENGRVSLDSLSGIRVNVRTGSYQEYLKSYEWIATRARALGRAERRCQVCNAGGHVDTHHRTYERIGKEEDADIIVLCRACHTLFHDNGRLAKPPTD
jgi:hypothetical protein